MADYGWWANTLVTGTEIFGGYALALAVGVLLALLFTWSKTLESLMLPLLVTLNMIPKVALGPLIIVWFKYGVFPNTMMAFSIAVFPILLTTARGCARSSPTCSTWCARCAARAGSCSPRSSCRARCPTSSPA